MDLVGGSNDEFAVMYHLATTPDADDGNTEKRKKGPLPSGRQGSRHVEDRPRLAWPAWLELRMTKVAERDRFRDVA